jgi:hypothetical protein
MILPSHCIVSYRCYKYPVGQRRTVLSGYGALLLQHSPIDRPAPCSDALVSPLQHPRPKTGDGELG